MVIVLTAWSAGAATPARRAAARSSTHTVVMDMTSYKPATLSLRRGDSVVWVNKDLFPHTATSKAAGFDSGAIAAGISWTWKATKAGEFPYACTFHPTMKGTLRVK